MKSVLDTPLFKNDKLYGTTHVGSKGQVVIPAQARKDLKIRPGDELVVIGKMGRLLGILKAEQLTEIVNLFIREIEKLGPKGLREKLTKHIDKTLKKL